MCAAVIHECGRNQRFDDRARGYVGRNAGPGLVVAMHHKFALRWNGTSKNVCDAPNFWHDKDGTPEWVREYDRPRQLELRQQRCQVDLGELESQWQKKANSQLARLLEAQAKYDEFADCR